MTEERFIRLCEVRRISGLSRSQIYALAKNGRFPAPIKLSTRCSAWLRSELAEWASERIATSRGPREQCDE